MGLDISTVRFPVFVPTSTEEQQDEVTHIYVPLAEWADRLDGRPEGFYHAEKGGSTGRWSYGGYNRLRELICFAAFDVPPQVVWADPERFADDGTFGGLVALVYFSDCEGAFGPVTSGRIAEALGRLDLSKIMDPDDEDYADRGVATLLACFTDAAAHDGFVVWS